MGPAPGGREGLAPPDPLGGLLALLLRDHGLDGGHGHVPVVGRVLDPVPVDPQDPVGPAEVPQGGEDAQVPLEPGQLPDPDRVQLPGLDVPDQPVEVLPGRRAYREADRSSSAYRPARTAPCSETRAGPRPPGRRRTSRSGSGPGRPGSRGRPGGRPGPSDLGGRAGSAGHGKLLSSGNRAGYRSVTAGRDNAASRT